MFKDHLPFDLKFSYSNEESRKLLGVPPVTGGGDYSVITEQLLIGKSIYMTVIFRTYSFQQIAR